MLLSVIIPVYNAGGCLSDALESVLDQEGTEYEILMVNDGSTDDTADIARDYERRFSNIHLISSKHLGVSHARNLGLDAAAGKYIAFLDADDVLCSGAFTRDVEEVLRMESYDLISFGHLHGNESLRWGRKVPERECIFQSENPRFRQMVTRKSFCSYLYRREMLEGLRFPEGIRYSEDAVFAYLAACRGKNMLCLDRYWFIYRNRVFSAMHSTGGWKYLLTDSIPAWFHAANSMDDLQVQWDCLGMVYEQTANYLRRGAMSGISLSQLLLDMKRSEAIQTVLANPGTYWTKKKTDAAVTAFRKHPRRTWLKYRTAGLFTETARKLSRTILIRYLYFRVRYRLDLSPWR